MANDYYELPAAALSNVRRKLDQMRLAGKNITPQMYTSLYEAELNALSDKRDRSRALSQQKEQYETTLAENKRQFDINQELKEEELSNQKTAGIGSMVGNIGTSALLYDVASRGKLSKTVGGWLGGGKEAAGEAVKEVSPAVTTQSTPWSTQTPGDIYSPGNIQTTSMTQPVSEVPVGVAGTGGTMSPPIITTMEADLAGAPYVGGIAEADAMAPGTAMPAAETPLMTYAGPAAAGLAAGQLAYQTGAGEAVADAIGMGGAHEGASIAGGLGGAGAGFLMSGFNPIGAIIGGLAGIVGGSSIFDDCIIVSCCNGRDSEEVRIAREFRDSFMSPGQIRGYYMIAEKVVPVLEAHPSLKVYVKEQLVDNLIEYGRFYVKPNRMGKLPSERSIMLSLWFLGLCEEVGKTTDRYTRVTGEVV